MLDKYILYPKTVVQITDEIKLLFSDYWDRKISKEDVKDILQHWAKNTPFLFYSADFTEENLNKSVRKIIGKKRVDLLFNILGEEDNKE